VNTTGPKAEAVVATLTERGPLTVAELCDSTKITTWTCTALLRDLKEQGAVTTRWLGDPPVVYWMLPPPPETGDSQSASSQGDLFPTSKERTP